MRLTGGGGCASIPQSAGITDHREPSSAQAVPTSLSCGTLVLPAHRTRKLILVPVSLATLNHQLNDGSVDGGSGQGVLHMSGEKSVNIVHEALRNACATRPSDASWGATHTRIATDCLLPPRSPTSMRDGGSMYSRDSVSFCH